MSDHLDAPGLKSPNMDARVDITDIFAFQNPADPTRSVLAMNVNPVAPTLADSFAPEALYELVLDTDGDTVADITYRVTFSPRENGDQKATVRRATGEEVRTAEISGEVLFRDVPVSFDGDAGVVESGDHEFFVGIRSDPFFFDLEGFEHDFEFTGNDFFIDKNVFSIVLEMPNKVLGEGQIGFWCRVLGPEDGDLSQIDRMDRPLTNMLYTEGEDKNAFNQVGPEQDRDLFLEKFEAVLEANGYGSGEARTVAETLLPDVLAYDHRAPAAFPNGRKLDDDIIDAALDLFTNGRITSDGVSPHRDMLYSFPYLGAPHLTPEGQRKATPDLRQHHDPALRLGEPTIARRPDMENGKANSGSNPKGRPRVVVVGSGFAGFTCARELERRLGPEDTELVLASPTDYLLYSPLLPEVATGAIDPRHIAVPLHGVLKRTRIMLGDTTGVDLDARTCAVRPPNAPERVLGWDRLVLAPGGVTRYLPIPGLAERARGLKSLGEAMYLRDHVLRQLELADASDNPDERRARCTFVVVGAGYVGTEFTAQMQHFTRKALANYPSLQPGDLRWMLLDLAPRVLPELGERLGEAALGLLRRRGVEVRLETSIVEANEESLKLSDGTNLPTRTLVWCVGVAASPLVATLGLPLEGDRLVVNERLTVPGRSDVFALGDCAAVPDLTRPGKVTPPTAQHAIRQGRTAACNVAASLGHGISRPYRHNDLGLVADLGGREAVAKPLGVEMSGLAAKAVTLAYHLYALPSTPHRLRVGLDWALDVVLPRPLVHLGLIREEDASLAVAERTGIYATPPVPLEEERSAWGRMIGANR